MTYTAMNIHACRPNLEVFSETLQALAAVDSNILVVTSDSRDSGKLLPFGLQFPDQIIEIGIAEQNLVGVAAGLASCGKKVFAVSPACFLTARALEQIKNDVAYADHPVKLIGISAGVSYGPLGSTHHSLHDFAVLRAIHNVTVIAPADNFETRQSIMQAVIADSPLYIRFGKKPMPEDTSGEQLFTIGKGRWIRKGNDISIIATGETVWSAARAAAKLAQDHRVHASVISMHTVKPIDYELLEEVAASGMPIVTVEEHSRFGGIGEACAAFLLEGGFFNKFKIMAIPDEYTVTGSQKEIFDHYGLNEEGITEMALKLLS